MILTEKENKVKKTNKQTNKKRKEKHACQNVRASCKNNDKSYRIVLR